MAAAAHTTYRLDDSASLYHGRKVVKLRELGGDKLLWTVRVVGTRIEFVTSQWRLAR